MLCCQLRFVETWNQCIKASSVYQSKEYPTALHTCGLVNEFIMNLKSVIDYKINGIRHTKGHLPGNH